VYREIMQAPGMLVSLLVMWRPRFDFTCCSQVNM